MKEGASRSVLRGIIQYDTLNEVNIRLSDGSKAFNYEGYTNIIFKVLKADGTAYIDSEGENVIATSPVDGIVTVNLNGQATTAAGLCQSVIEIYSGEDKMTTARLNYEVFEDLDLDEVEVSESQYPVFQNLMADLSALEASIEAAEAARVAAEVARASEASGYVAMAEAAKNAASASAVAAEEWAKKAKDIAGSKFAPDGYGLGVSSAYNLTSADDLNSVTANGWYQWTNDKPVNAKLDWCMMRVFSAMESYTVQEIISGNVPGCILRRSSYGDRNAWIEEWINPPMFLGNEYRTTERYLGKPVYAKLFITNVPASTTVTVPYAENVQNIVYANVYAASADQYNTGDFVSVAGARKSGVILKNAGTTDAANCCVHMKYTKTTDT